MKCAECDERTPVTDEGVKKHRLAGDLVALLHEFSLAHEIQVMDAKPNVPTPSIRDT